MRNTLSISGLLIILLVIFSCSNDLNVVQPEFSDGTILTGTTDLSPQLAENIQGVYTVSDSKHRFGDYAVLRVVKDKICIYFQNFGVYFIANSGALDSIIIGEGLWRNPVNVSTGLVRLYSDRIGRNNDISKLTAYFGDGNSPLTEKIVLNYSRKFSDKILNGHFQILAHRGGGRNSDYLGVSENSVEIIKKAEFYGATGIEIDVKISKDGIPFLYHDLSINRRLLRPTTLVGRIEDLTFRQIKSFLTLKNGEAIPSLEEALNAVIYNTHLQTVWLDMKSDRASVAIVSKIQKEMQLKAESIGRDLILYMGVPSEDIYNDLISQPDYRNIISLCELKLDDVRALNSRVWAPRWTLGAQTEKVRQMHSEGRLAFTWTLDQASNIRTFVNETEFDGILTNYPTIVAFNYYVKK